MAALRLAVSVNPYFQYIIASSEMTPPFASDD